MVSMTTTLLFFLYVLRECNFLIPNLSFLTSNLHINQTQINNTTEYIIFNY